MVKLLIVEDDISVRKLMTARLKRYYDIVEARHGQEALDVIETEKVDVMVVDIDMPVMNGYEFVAAIRDSGDRTPILFLTAMTSFSHKKQAFELEIDDYLTKPIDYEELQWHLEAVLRRAKIANEQQIHLNDFCLDKTTKAATIGEETVQFTGKEFDLLYKLLSYPGQIFTKQQLMDDIWGYETESDYDTIKTYINRLRKKLVNCSAFSIVAIRGLGYKVELEEGADEKSI
ncbi:response regulator transcription factor [Streptococcus sp. S784/96/1]|uniref:response regulator transcription factor n=1 Tax=Streptococcus sp. S784/96/1 TaxID=2653499 RepID=UPI0013873727|nr:response regulator transcription factor [Streptococcus sp. S784/96/1]